MKVLATQSCLICDPMDYSLSGFSVHRILQARMREWVAVPFSRDLPDPGVEPRSPALWADYSLSETPGSPYMEYYPIPISSHCCTSELML